VGYGFGSYTFTDGVMQFLTFLLNVLYRAGLVPHRQGMDGRFI